MFVDVVVNSVLCLVFSHIVFVSNIGVNQHVRLGQSSCLQPLHMSQCLYIFYHVLSCSMFGIFYHVLCSSQFLCPVFTHAAFTHVSVQKHVVC